MIQPERARRVLRKCAHYNEAHGAQHRSDLSEVGVPIDDAIRRRSAVLSEAALAKVPVEVLEMAGRISTASS